MSCWHSPIAMPLRTMLLGGLLVLLGAHVDAAFSASMPQILGQYSQYSLLSSQTNALRRKVQRRENLNLARQSQHICAMSSVPGEREDMYSKGRHTYVEGERFDDRCAEIEAMGGDPFFVLDDEGPETIIDDESDNQTPSLASFAVGGGTLSSLGIDSIAVPQWSSTNGMGPKPSKAQHVVVEEWDGWEVEDAHFDE